MREKQPAALDDKEEEEEEEEENSLSGATLSNEIRVNSEVRVRRLSII
jgi:hypothetical protein